MLRVKPVTDLFNPSDLYVIRQISKSFYRKSDYVSVSNPLKHPHFPNGETSTSNVDIRYTNDLNFYGKFIYVKKNWPVNDNGSRPKIMDKNGFVSNLHKTIGNSRSRFIKMPFS